ncbi:integrase catalytic domain-containing protein [Trichonephila clavipes]|nr:integrase catalytic domain-containing protein [Trichonephila clavipes]
MELHKLCANHEKLSPYPEQNYNFATLKETKTLGVSWKPNIDCFLIKVKLCLDSSYTKRDVLSTIAKMFDPVGLMAPVISKAKIFLQQVIEIHGFADASEWCYNAAVYCKSKNLKSETLVRLITSKWRVAPIKSLTIPRLELCAAVLLAKLVKRVVAALQLETAEVYLWSDSMIVLAWLRKEPMDLRPLSKIGLPRYKNSILISYGDTFVENLKDINRVSGPLTIKEFEKAETFLVKKVQEQEFSSDINHVKRVDFSGPFFIKNKGQRKGNLFKVYICIFVCFVFKAVHIELVSDLTSQAFIAALKRFMARRGKCAKLFSDNGKNFVGASNEIKKLLEIVRNPDEKLAHNLAAEGIEWKFIPARSPNFGGLWEAAIKSCKYHLERVVNGINLTYEELLTVTVQIEGILNFRPLCPLSNNDDDFQVLTPAHFLINRSLNSLEEPNLTKCKESNLKKWQKITTIVQLMWKFWSHDYLNQ